MLALADIHHIAIICSDYQRSQQFYTEVLGLEILHEHYREARDSYKLDLGLQGRYLIELFSFPASAERPSYPEARGLRHLAFAVQDMEGEVEKLKAMDIAVEAVRIDEITGKRFTFFSDPDGLPIELYEL